MNSDLSTTLSSILEAAKTALEIKATTTLAPNDKHRLQLVNASVQLAQEVMQNPAICPKKLLANISNLAQHAAALYPEEKISVPASL